MKKKGESSYLGSYSTSPGSRKKGKGGVAASPASHDPSLMGNRKFEGLPDSLEKAQELASPYGGGKASPAPRPAPSPLDPKGSGGGVPVSPLDALLFAPDDKPTSSVSDIEGTARVLGFAQEGTGDSEEVGTPPRAQAPEDEEPSLSSAAPGGPHSPSDRGAPLPRVETPTLKSMMKLALREGQEVLDAPPPRGSIDIVDSIRSIDRSTGIPSAAPSRAHSRGEMAEQAPEPQWTPGASETVMHGDVVSGAAGNGNGGGGGEEEGGETPVSGRGGDPDIPLSSRAPEFVSPRQSRRNSNSGVSPNNTLGASASGTTLEGVTRPMELSGGVEAAAAAAAAASQQQRQQQLPRGAGPAPVQMSVSDNPPSAGPASSRYQREPPHFVPSPSPAWSPLAQAELSLSQSDMDDLRGGGAAAAAAQGVPPADPRPEFERFVSESVQRLQASPNQQQPLPRSILGQLRADGTYSPGVPKRPGLSPGAIPQGPFARPGPSNRSASPTAADMIPYARGKTASEVMRSWPAAPRPLARNSQGSPKSDRSNQSGAASARSTDFSFMLKGGKPAAAPPSAQRALVPGTGRPNVPPIPLHNLRGGSVAGANSVGFNPRGSIGSANSRGSSAVAVRSVSAGRATSAGREVPPSRAAPSTGYPNTSLSLTSLPPPARRSRDSSPSAAIAVPEAELAALERAAEEGRRLRRQLREAQESLQEESTRGRRRIKELEDERRAASDKVEASLKEAEGARQRLKYEQQRGRAQKEALASMEERLRKRDEVLKEFREGFVRIQETIAGLEAQVSSLRGENQALKEASETVEGRVTAARVEAEQAKAELGRVRAELQRSEGLARELRELAAADLEELRRRHETEVTDIRRRHTRELEESRRQSDAVRRETEDLLSEAGEREVRAAREGLREEHKAELESVRAALRSELVEAVEKAKAMLQADHSRELEAVKDKARVELAAEREAGRKEGREQAARERDIYWKGQMEVAKRDIEAKHAQEMKVKIESLQVRHESELQGLETMLRTEQRAAAKKREELARQGAEERAADQDRAVSDLRGRLSDMAADHARERAQARDAMEILQREMSHLRAERAQLQEAVRRLVEQQMAQGGAGAPQSAGLSSRGVTGGQSQSQGGSTAQSPAHGPNPSPLGPNEAAPLPILVPGVPPLYPALRGSFDSGAGGGAAPPLPIATGSVHGSRAGSPSPMHGFAGAAPLPPTGRESVDSTAAGSGTAYTYGAMPGLGSRGAGQPGYSDTETPRLGADGPFGGPRAAAPPVTVPHPQGPVSESADEDDAETPLGQPVPALPNAVDPFAPVAEEEEEETGSEGGSSSEAGSDSGEEPQPKRPASASISAGPVSFDPNADSTVATEEDGETGTSAPPAAGTPGPYGIPLPNPGDAGAAAIGDTRSPILALQLIQGGGPGGEQPRRMLVQQSAAPAVPGPGTAAPMFAFTPEQPSPPGPRFMPPETASPSLPLPQAAVPPVLAKAPSSADRPNIFRTPQGPQASGSSAQPSLMAPQIMSPSSVQSQGAFAPQPQPAAPPPQAPPPPAPVPAPAAARPSPFRSQASSGSSTFRSGGAASTAMIYRPALASPALGSPFHPAEYGQGGGQGQAAAPGAPPQRAGEVMARGEFIDGSALDMTASADRTMDEGRAMDPALLSSPASDLAPGAGPGPGRIGAGVRGLGQPSNRPVLTPGSARESVGSVSAGPGSDLQSRAGNGRAPPYIADESSPSFARGGAYGAPPEGYAPNAYGGDQGDEHSQGQGKTARSLEFGFAEIHIKTPPPNHDAKLQLASHSVVPTGSLATPYGTPYNQGGRPAPGAGGTPPRGAAAGMPGERLEGRLARQMADAGNSPIPGGAGGAQPGPYGTPRTQKVNELQRELQDLRTDLVGIRSSLQAGAKQVAMRREVPDKYL